MSLDNKTIVCDYCGSRHDIPCVYYNVTIITTERDMCSECYDKYSQVVVNNFSQKILAGRYCEITGQSNVEVVRCTVDKVYLSTSGAIVDNLVLEFKAKFGLL